MNVVDAGVVVALLAGDLDPAALGDADLGAPHLLDSEVLHVLRSLVLRGTLTEAQGTRAVAAFAHLDIARFSADGLLARIWDLRHNLSGYDATYVALAEAVGADALLTTDARLARASGVRCPVRVL